MAIVAKPVVAARMFALSTRVQVWIALWAAEVVFVADELAYTLYPIL